MTRPLGYIYSDVRGSNTITVNNNVDYIYYFRQRNGQSLSLDFVDLYMEIVPPIFFYEQDIPEFYIRPWNCA